MKDKELLVIVDMQNDFIDGSLGTKEAQGIVKNVCDVIRDYKGRDIAVTMDTHHSEYLLTLEGKNLPIPHCIYGQTGHELNKSVKEELYKNENRNLEFYYKESFGSLELCEHAKKKKYDIITLVGLCSDICVISNALLLKAYCKETQIRVLEWCTAGVSKESHNRAIKSMETCQIEVISKNDVE